APDPRIEEELRRQIAQGALETTQLRKQWLEANNARATAEGSRVASEKLLAEQQELHEKARREMKESQNAVLNDLREAFKALSADALKQIHPEFLRLAGETLGRFHESAKGELAQRQEAIATLVKPLEEQLKVYQQRLQQSDLFQSTALGDVKR